MIGADWRIDVVRFFRRGARYLLSRYFRLITGNQQHFILILAHMRSGSTLLAHILMSHPEVLGLGERNAPYRSQADVERLIVDSYWHYRRWRQPIPYVVDQLNHNRFLSPELLAHPHGRFIFLIREPEASLASMVDVLGHFYGFSLDDALTYYPHRLHQLAQYAQTLNDPQRGFYLSYTDLTQRTEHLLPALQHFLQMKHPLTPDYHQFSFTGQHGDPSPRIRTGNIQPPTSRPLPDLPVAVRRHLQEVYHATENTLRDKCTHL